MLLPRLAIWHLMVATAMLALAIVFPDILAGPLMIVAVMMGAGLSASLIIAILDRHPRGGRVARRRDSPARRD